MSDGDVDRRGAEPLEHAQPGRVRRRHHHGDLPDDVAGQLAGAPACSVSTSSSPASAIRKLRIPPRRRARRPRRRRRGRAGRAAGRMRGAVGRARVRADVEALARPDEERDLDAGLRADRRHLAQLRLAQQHRAAALRDAVDDDPLRPRRAHDLLEHARALDARDLDAEVRAVGEARALAARGGAPRDCRRAARRRPSCARLPVVMSRTPCARGPPRPRRGQSPVSVSQRRPSVLDRIRVLGLAAARDARIPGDRVPRRRCAARYQRLSRCARDDLELALAIGDRAALVVLAPCAGMPGLGVGLVADARSTSP